MIEVKREYAGRQLRLETGRMAKQAAGSAVVQFGDTVVIASVAATDSQSQLPFFPLTVEYREKFYAAGRIPGGFIKRESRPSEQEVLSARVIDRSIRPLFPSGFQNEVQVFVYVISTDQENPADVVGLNAASAALAISKVPWNGPVAAVRVGRIDGEYILNPTIKELEYSELDIVVAGNAESIQMVEGGALELTEDEVADALAFAQKGLAEMVEVQDELISQAQQPEMEWEPYSPSEDLTAKVKEAVGDGVEKATTIADKAERSAAMEKIEADVIEALAEEFPDSEGSIRAVLKDMESASVRGRILSEDVRIDGRDSSTVRDIECVAGLIPRAHGSALFTRGQTQALVTTTLGSVADEQRIDSIEGAEQTSKSFMLHYNFPSFSVGEVRPIRGPSRREIGHGVLAERALQPLLPTYEEFPYTIRVVSEILESNGSSSMATVCGGSLALMDAGVPMKAPCAGVAMGLIKEGDKVAVLTDILGAEDHLGDMDFKVAGTKDGITSIQMDIKIEGLDLDLMKSALAQAREARHHILGVMSKTVAAHRESLSPYAPRIITVKINPEKIGDVIGPKGKMIRAIQEETGAQINVDDEGTVTIAAVNGDAGEAARSRIEDIVAEPEVGRVYEGVVKSTTNFGAFVEIMPGTEGLLHISELQHERTNKTEDVVKKGDMVKVKLLSIDDRGKLKLSRKVLLDKPEARSEK